MTEPNNDTDARARLQWDSDFVNLRRYGYSLKKTLEENPEGVSDRVIAQALMLEDESQVQTLWESAVEKLRHALGV